MVILIVEDVILIGWALKAVLLVGGHRALGPAQSADEALRIARAERPELAFVDINIAGNRDGIALARILTEQHRISCIFLTVQAAQARQAKDAALGLVAKPYDPRELLDTVEAVAAIRSGRIPPRSPLPLELFC